MNTKRFIKKTGLYFIGNLSTKILAFILVPIYAIYLTPEDLGKFDYIITIQNMIMPICILAIWEAVLKFILSEDDENKKKEIINVSAIFTIIQTIVFGILTIIYLNIIKNDNKYYVVLIFITYAITIVWQYFARALNKNKLYVVSSMVGTITNLITNIILLCFFRLGIYALFISYILSNLAIIMIIEGKIKIIRDINIRKFNFKIFEKMIKFSVPLIINLISIWLLSGFARVIIINVLGENSNGLYTFANKFSTVVNLVGSILGMAFIEEAIIMSKENKMDNQFFKGIENIFNLLLSMAILMIPCISIFYKMIDTTEFISSLKYVPLLLIYSVLMSMATVIGGIYQAINKTKYISITTIIGALLTVGFSIAFINKYNVFAVIIAQIIGAFIMLFIRFVLIKRFIDIKIKFNNMIFLLIIYVLTNIISLKNNIIGNIIIEVILVTILLYLNKENIVIIYEKIKTKEVQKHAKIKENN